MFRDNCIKVCLLLLVPCLGLMTVRAEELPNHSGASTSPAPRVESSNKPEGWGNLSGRIVVIGSVPVPEKLAVTQDQAFCSRHGLVDESLIVAENGGLKNVFVYLYQSRREKQEPPVHESYADTAGESVVLDNIKCRFEPHTLFMRTTQPMIAKNSDEVGHNANIESRNNAANPQIPASGSEELSLAVPEREPVKVSCGSHGWMSAYVLVRDEPYAAITAEDGTFEIKNLPAGEWTFQFWHERSKAITDLAKDGEVIVGRRGEITIEIRDGETTDLGELQIEVGFLAD